MYVHWPFCSARCSYCDFRAFPYQEKRIPAYAQALAGEIRMQGEKMGHPRLSSLYFGGGTPSHVSESCLNAVMQTIAASFVMPAEIEKTIEANPEDITRKNAEALAAMGFNRVSLGVQTFDDTIARAIGRVHTSEEAVHAVHLLHDAGITNISVDLMTGLPGQTPGHVENDLSVLQTLPVQHLSVYTLTLAEHTHMHRQYQTDPSRFPNEAEERRLAHLAARTAEAMGLLRYEISNYAKPGMESQHNLAYWRLADYLGTGLSASSYYGGAHHRNTDSLQAYMQMTKAQQIPVAETEPLNEKELLTELLLVGLRLREGIRFESITERTGFRIEQSKAEVISAYTHKGWIRPQTHALALTAAGADRLDTILMDLIDE